MFKFIKETNGIAIFSFLLGLFCFLIPFTSPLVSYPFPREVFYAVLDSGCPTIALILGIIALIWCNKKKQKGKWLAILAVILGSLASFYL